MGGEREEQPDDFHPNCFRFNPRLFLEMASKIVDILEGFWVTKEVNWIFWGGNGNTCIPSVIK